MKGVYHIHSNFSYDGVNSIKEIVEWAKAQSLNFIILTEHDQGYDQNKFKNYIHECKEASNLVKVIPGIEYSLEEFGKSIHISVLDVSCFIEQDIKLGGISIFLEKVKELGGIAILNHPTDVIASISDSLLTRFDLIEIWNTKYDPDYSPNIKTLKLSTCSPNFNTYFIASSDIHEIPIRNYVCIDINYNISSDISEEDILNLIKTGHFSTSYKSWIFSSLAEVTYKHWYQRLLPFISCFHHSLYNALKSFARKINYKPPSIVVKTLKLKFRK